jgi:hypothetical protein
VRGGAVTVRLAAAGPYFDRYSPAAPRALSNVGSQAARPS